MLYAESALLMLSIRHASCTFCKFSILLVVVFFTDKTIEKSVIRQEIR